jgi:hypothetical protein
MAKDTTTASGEPMQKPTIAQTIAAAILGFLAVKIATTIVTTLWRLVTREEPPQIDMDDVGALKKAAWVAAVGAATGAARQSARDIVKPPKAGPA